MIFTNHDFLARLFSYHCPFSNIVEHALDPEFQICCCLWRIFNFMIEKKKHHQLIDDINIGDAPQKTVAD